MARSDMVSRRILMKRNACNDWIFQLSWSGSHGKCDRSCSEYFEMIGEQCIKDKSSNKGSLDVGCGIYNFEVKAAFKTTTTKSVSSTSRKTFHKSTTTSTSFTSKGISHTPPRTSSSQKEVASKSVSTPSKAHFLTSTLATTESFSPSPTDSSYRPLIVGEAVCEDEADLPGHAPINEEHQSQLASIACLSLRLVQRISSMGSHSKPITYSANP
jgi:hypothetical protein